MHLKTQNHFVKFSIHFSVRQSQENYRQIYGKSKASLWRNLSTGCSENFLAQSFVQQLQFILMHQSIPAAPSPSPPGLLWCICPPGQSRGWGICKFCAARGPGICQPRGHSWAFDTHAVSYQHITTQGILLGKKAYWLICQGRKKIKRFVKACS